MVRAGEEKGLEAALNGLGYAYFREDLKMAGEDFIRYTIIAHEDDAEEVVKQVERFVDTRKEGNMIIIQNISAYISKQLEKPEERESRRVVEEITQPLEKFLKPDPDFILVVIIASLIAMAGMVLNNPVIVIGAMLVSPLLGPINAIVVNTSLGRMGKAFRAWYSLLLSLTSATALTLVSTTLLSNITTIPTTEQFLARTYVTTADIFVALLLGVAGGMALTRALAETLVGVAVAASLLPPSTALGMAIALNKPSLSIGALTLLAVNLIGLNLGGMATLLFKKIEPRFYHERKKARIHSIYTITILATILTIIYLLAI